MNCSRNFGAKLLFASTVSLLLLSRGVTPTNAAPHELSNGTGDGSLTVGVDGFGAFGSSNGSDTSDAIYDPVGSVEAAGTVYRSTLSINSGTPEWLASDDLGYNPVITGDANLATSSFTIGDLEVDLVQRLLDSFDVDGSRLGTILDQRYQVTNTSSTTFDFDLTRYVDGDLNFDGTIQDGGGLLERAENLILYETDAAGGSAAATTFVGITSSTGDLGDININGHYEIDSFSGLRSRIASGTDLDNSISGDNDGDNFIDTPYDLALALSHSFSLLANESATYVTQTLFGNAIPPVPGSSESLPLLPVFDEPPFLFTIEIEDPNEIIWFDPEVSTGFEFEINGVGVDAVQMPSSETVPQPGSYELYVYREGTLVFEAFVESGELYEFDDEVSHFQIRGISPTLGLDPNDPLAFPTGLRFAAANVVSLSMTPLVAVVPEPSTAWLLVTVVGLAGVVRKSN